MATELNEYFCADGRSFSSVFVRGEGGDQSFGIYTSDGVDVGQQYQRAITTFNSGFFVGNEDIGRKMLNRDALVLTEVVGEQYVTFNKYHHTSSKPSNASRGFEYTINFKLNGGSGKFGNFEWFSEGDRFGTLEFLNTNYSRRGFRSKRKPVESTYNEANHILTGNFSALWSYAAGYRAWKDADTTQVRVRFTDLLTGVSYVSVPLTFVNILQVGKKPEWAWLGRRCDIYVACSDCSCDTYSSDSDRE